MLNSGDIGFMIIAATYVFLMTPGLAFFYGGLAQRKNVLNTMMMSVAFMGLSSVLWVLCGYSLSFSGDLGGVIGNLKWFALTVSERRLVLTVTISLIWVLRCFR